MNWLRNMGPMEVILVLAVVVLLFGAKRIPELARSLGRSLSEFKKGQQEGASSGTAEEKKGDKQPPAGSV